MKMALVISAVLGLTASSAMAECAYHSAQAKTDAKAQQAAVTETMPASSQEQAMVTQPTAASPTPTTTE